ncbi:MAG: MBL fold metallo-hydrolase [Anaerolineales bacterium]|jgi:hydroxyacylglutathione hydrolase
MRIKTLKLIMSNAYLVDWGAGLALIDAGIALDRTRILRHLRGRERDLRVIVLTHAHLDHYGAAAAVQAATGAPVAIHGADAEPMRQGKSVLGSGRRIGKLMVAAVRLLEPAFRVPPCDPNFLLEDGMLLHHLGVPGRVLHTPGHTAGSCSFLFNGGNLFVGDLVGEVIYSRRPHAQRFLAQDWAVLPDSLRRLQTANAEWLYPGHGRAPIPGSVLPQLIRQVEAAYKA